MRYLGVVLWMRYYILDTNLLAIIGVRMTPCDAQLNGPINRIPLRVATRDEVGI